MTCNACAPYLSDLEAGETITCRACGGAVRGSDRVRRGWQPGAPAADLACLARWLPDLCPRALEPCPVTCGPGHSGPSPGALAGRPDRIDARSTSYARAVAVWRRLRALVGAGRGVDVAALWTAHALVVDLAAEATVRAGRQAEAVALGAAPRPLREEWSTVAREPCGPRVQVQAAVWGAERLEPLWSPGPVPPALALGAALGLAPAALRERWGHLRSPALRDAAVRAWGSRRLAGAEEVWCGTTGEERDHG